MRGRWHNSKGGNIKDRTFKFKSSVVEEKGITYKYVGVDQDSTYILRKKMWFLNEINFSEGL